ncbi:MAG: DNA polymerase III subunit epsilon [Gammaproteobacteria bacterium]|nr:DNA polymerase III subunit epsilon [Gammaproteobacteria bacterium]NKB62741.1 DNA polymerase III subunit epsilon [Gammaproteobacteria bacterium]
MRQIILDTETTGLETSQGHRIIEVGAIEMINRRLTQNRFHQYINPEREIDEAAQEVHGISLESLQDKPLFGDLAQELFDFLKGAELIIHNAPFDVGFLNHEFKLAGHGESLIGEHCTILDTLAMARSKHPGQKNNLDALCRRYDVDNTQRTLHGALLDAEILADVYLMMTGGQTTLLGENEDITEYNSQRTKAVYHADTHISTPIILASEEEMQGHEQWMQLIEKSTGEKAIWQKINGEAVVSEHD